MEHDNELQGSQNSELDENDLQQLEESAKPENTTRNTKYGLKKFTEWSIKRSIEVDFHSITATELNDILQRYFAEMKASKLGTDTHLTPSTLTCLRASIHITDQ